MKPTQEQILSALNKLIKESKTELKTEKVELSMNQDLKISVNSLDSNSEILTSVSGDIVKIISQMSSILPKAQDKAKLGKSMIKATESKIDLAQKTVKEAEALGKELGIDTSKIPSIVEIEKLIKSNTKGLKTILRYQDALDKIASIKI
tara:strand:+ start:362 stop:808 length:447 start_codon:yes stop_codon:yes gene_type:complete